MTKLEAPWALSEGCSLFLDFDGTLVDLAPTPDKVTVDTEIRIVLAKVRRRLNDAFAIVSGRTLDQLDQFLDPECGTMACEHGAIIRYADGAMEFLPQARPMPSGWIEFLRARAKDWDGVIVEPKKFGVAVHYRKVPDMAETVIELVRGLCEGSQSHFAHQAKMAIEIRPKGVSKAIAVERLMQHSPFSLGIPIFIGDDETDEDGISAVEKLGGRGFRVGHSFLSTPSDVRRWLTEFAAGELKNGAKALA